MAYSIRCVSGAAVSEMLNIHPHLWAGSGEASSSKKPVGAVLLPLSAARKLTKPNDAIVVTSGYRRGATVVNLPELYTGIELTCEF